ncbi:uncharacterized protein LOC142802939 [Rhipicephalus microplus]|uniref:uncharacterized protein LOC142802939 n=1 Tax=Rhipicephalus microplus TaxID=6941 RepID=UPI003F6BE99A
MDTTPNSDATPSPTVPDAVVATLRLAEFWQVDSELWFISVEPLFRRHRDILKEGLIRRTTESEQRRLQQLLTSEEFSDRTPTVLLRRMRHLIGDHSAALDASIVRELFLQRLTNQVRIILSVSLESLARMADKIMNIGAPSISAIERPWESTLSAPVRDDCLDRLLQVKEEVKHKVTELSMLKVDHRHNASRQRCQSHDRSPSLPRGVCLYHNQYGARARQCKKPCQLAGNAQATH